MQETVQPQADIPAVLSKATLRTGDLLHLNNASLARVIGVSEPTITSVGAGQGIDPATKEGQLALLLVRVFRSLDSFVGGADAKRVAWMHSHNKALQGVPAKLVENPEGLMATLAYLDGMCAPAGDTQR